MSIDGLTLRRLRQARGLSQGELARRTSMSQPFISYIERGTVTPSALLVERLATALGTTVADLETKTGLSGEVDGTPGLLGDTEDDGYEVDDNLDEVATDFALWSLALGPQATDTLAVEVVSGNPRAPPGDLVLLIDLDTHVFYVVVDGRGSGQPAALRAMMASAAIHGAIRRGTRGIPAPDDLVEVVNSLWTVLGHEDRQVELWVGRLERATRKLLHARTEFPAPYLRSDGSTSLLVGRRHAWGNWHSGVQELATDALLVVVTDGVANRATKNGRPLWSSAEVRAQIHRGSDPQDLAKELARRGRTHFGPSEQQDDQTILVIRP